MELTIAMQVLCLSLLLPATATFPREAAAGLLLPPVLFEAGAPWAGCAVG